MAMNQMYPLHQVVGKEVKVNRGGPDSLVGKLLSVQSDYLVIRTKDGVVYINSNHVKSISLTSNTSGSNRSYSDYISAHNFQMLLHALNRHFVQINRGGPEKIEGFIIEVNQSFVTLVVAREIVRIPIFHIKSINVQNSSKGNKSNKSNKSNINKSNINKSNINKSDINRSGANTGLPFQRALVLRLMKRK